MKAKDVVYSLIWVVAITIVSAIFIGDITTALIIFVVAIYLEFRMLPIMKTNVNDGGAK